MKIRNRHSLTRRQAKRRLKMRKTIGIITIILFSIFMLSIIIAVLAFISIALIAAFGESIRMQGTSNFPSWMDAIIQDIYKWSYQSMSTWTGRVAELIIVIIMILAGVMSSYITGESFISLFKIIKHLRRKKSNYAICKALLKKYGNDCDDAVNDTDNDGNQPQDDDTDDNYEYQFLSHSEDPDYGYSDENPD